MKLYYIILPLIVLVTACTGLPNIFGGDVLNINTIINQEGPKDSVVIKNVQTIPTSPMLPDRDIEFFFSIENKDDQKPAENVAVSLFDAPTFKDREGTLCNSAGSKCIPDICYEGHVCELPPGDEKVITYKLKAPSKTDIVDLETPTKLNFKVNYDYDTSLIFIVPVVDMEEVLARQRAGAKTTIDISKIHGSGPVKIDAEIVGAPYMLEGYTSVINFKIKKTGSEAGTIEGSVIPIGSMTIKIPKILNSKHSDKIFNNDYSTKIPFGGEAEQDLDVWTNQQPISLYKGETKTSLRFEVSPEPITVPFQSYDITATLDYTYEVRGSESVKISPR
ncbi:MAG: hypothetical protein V1802_02315 [Candidatus Aenigmatarchaeota archaeon]